VLTEPASRTLLRSPIPPPSPPCSEFGLPSQIRDIALGRKNEAPTSDINKRASSSSCTRCGNLAFVARADPTLRPHFRLTYLVEYYAQNMERELADSTTNGAGSSTSIRSSSTGKEMLKAMAKTDPNYSRNRAHVCSFFAKGDCARGAECPYR